MFGANHSSAPTTSPQPSLGFRSCLLRLGRGPSGAMLPRHSGLRARPRGDSAPGAAGIGLTRRRCAQTTCTSTGLVMRERCSSPTRRTELEQQTASHGRGGGLERGGHAGRRHVHNRRGGRGRESLRPHRGAGWSSARTKPAGNVETGPFAKPAPRHSPLPPLLAGAGGPAAIPPPLPNRYTPRERGPSAQTPRGQKRAATPRLLNVPASVVHRSEEWRR